MKIVDYFKKIRRLPGTRSVDPGKWKRVAEEILKRPSDGYSILKKEFIQEMRNKAIADIENKIKSEKKYRNITAEDKEDLVEEREKELWQKVKSGGTLAFAIIFGISL